jgi:hypothetical protein
MMEDHITELSPAGLKSDWLAYLNPIAIGQFLLLPTPRYVICWIIAVWIAGITMYESWNCWNEPARRDGNWGHATIDFGGQYLMGRMIAEGRGHRLYSRQDHRAVLEAAYPREDCKPDAEKDDVEELMGWMMSGQEPEQENFGGPMYPPVHAVLYAPLGLLMPQHAYRLTQVLVLAAAWLCGWQIRQLSDGRVWWPVAASMVTIFPGFTGAIHLGQNSAFTLAILLGGWCLLKKGHSWWGGLTWGLLAYKPVWAAAYLLGPVLLRRWRFAAAMVLSGAAIVAATLPLVGVQTWRDWLAVGRIGAFEYTRQQPWINLSRDMLSIPRRWMLHFEGGIATEESLERPLPTILGMILWLTPPALTVLLTLTRPRQFRSVTGTGAAFVLLGAYFACYHFMYYDLLLAALPLTLLFADPARFLPLLRWRGLFPPPDAEPSAQSPLLFAVLRGSWVSAFTLRPRWFRNLWALALLAMLLLSPVVFYLWSAEEPSPPWDALCLFGFWLWCGWEVLTAHEVDVASIPLQGKEKDYAERAELNQAIAVHLGERGRQSPDSEKD